MTVTVEHDGKVIEFPDAETANKFFANQQPSAEKIVAKTDDGGRVVDMGQGQLTFVSPSYSTSNPETIKRIMAGDNVQMIQQDNQDAATLEHFGKGAGATANFLKGVPFVGEWFDEAMGPERGQAMNQMAGAFERQNPKSAIASRIAGGIVGTAPVVAAAAPTAVGMGAATLGARVLQGVTAGGLMGAVEGGVQGAGRAEDEGRGANAKDGAIVGGLLGSVLGGAAPVVSDSVKSVLMRVKGSGLKEISRQLGISKEAAQAVKTALDGDDLATAAKAIENAGDGAMLLDASNATRSLAQAASKSGGAAQKTIQNAVEDRVNATSQSVVQGLDNAMGAPPSGLMGAAEEIASRTAPKRAAAYDAAFASPIDYASQQGRNVEEVLSRIPPARLNQAIKQANEQMTWRGASNKQIMAEVADDGAVKFVEMPNVEQLNALKIELDNIGRAGVDNFGRPTAEGRLARDMASGVRDATVDAAPAYGEALKVGGDKIAMDQALEMGSKLMRPGVTREDVFRQLGSASLDERNAAKAGVRMYFDDALANIKKVASDPNIEARQLNKAWSELSSPANRAKLDLVLGKSEAAALFKGLDEAEYALSARAAVSRNSDTAINQAIQRNVEESVQPGALSKVLSGQPVAAVQEVIQSVTGADASVSQAQKAQIFNEIAEALVGKKGKTAETALKLIDSAMAGERLTAAQSSVIAHAVSGQSAGAAYQYGKQQLTTRSGVQ